MPVYYQQNINETTRLAVWKIAEEENFFLEKVAIDPPASHPNKRLQHLAGRYLLQYLYPDFPIELIRIADTKKPYLQDDPLHFSISHAGEYAAAIISSTQRVGIDIEIVSPRVEKIKHKFLHSTELESIAHLSGDELINQLTLLWSAKEAVFKWWGKGGVDFSEMIRTSSFSCNTSGLILGEFLNNEFSQSLELYYRLSEGTSLVWVAGN